MLIDWFTVIAQFVNFIILVVALKFLLYDRVVDAMETRRRAIAEREATADARTREAEEELARLHREGRELDKQREGILEQVHLEAADRRRQLLHQAREDVGAQAEEWRKSIRRRQERLLSDLQRLTGEKAVSVARRLLADMADMAIEEAAVRGLEQRITEIPDEEKSAVADSARSPGAVIEVRSAFEPSPSTRNTVQKALNELLGGADPPIRWEMDPDLIFGVVVRVGAHRLGWSVAGYLDDVEQEFADLLRAESGHIRPEGGE